MEVCLEDGAHMHELLTGPLNLPQSSLFPMSTKREHVPAFTVIMPAPSMMDLFSLKLFLSGSLSQE